MVNVEQGLDSGMNVRFEEQHGKKLAQGSFKKQKFTSVAVSRTLGA